MNIIHPKICAIIEARTTSTRLPGKILLKINNKTILEHLVSRLKKIKKIDSIIVATTTNNEDDSVVQLAKKLDVKFYRGEENNVLKRVIDAAKFFRVKTIVRITSDCPLADLNMISQYIDIFCNNSCDIVSNAHIRSYPVGMDIEIINAKALAKSYRFAKSPHLKEHICLTMYKYNKIFKICNIIAPPNLFYPKLGLTLDEYNDFILIEKIIKYMTKKKIINFSCEDILNLINSKGWMNINKVVKRTKHKYYKYITPYYIK